MTGRFAICVAGRPRARRRRFSRRATFVAGVLLIVFGSAFGGNARAEWTKLDDYIIHAGHLLATPGEAVARERTIVVLGGEVVSVESGYRGPQELARVPADARVLDLREYFVLPGLIDAHVHITSESGPGFKLRRVVQSGHDQVISGVMNARKTLLAGFTTVRDTAGFRGNDFEAVFALRDGIANGKVAGPRLLVSGQGIGPTAGHGDFLGYRPDILKLLSPPSLCDGADECRKTTRYMVKRGADFIKIAVTGGVTSEINAGLDQQMTDEEISAVVETAHALGRKVAAHAHGKNGIETALRLGVDSIEHGTFMDEETAKLFIEKGAFLVPTLLAQKAAAERVANDSSLPEAVREKSQNRSAMKRNQVRMAYREGVKMAFGTDSAISPHGRNAEEFALLVDAGVQPMDAIKMATLNAAELLGVEDVTGSIVPGKFADIIAVKRNPLENIRALEDVDFVMKEGIVYKPCDCGDPSE